ncbi:hypothetical protein QR680_006289 [Steinernema hermaphroditum]|uniref:TIL domain-containing protein n=1 Tax=Steinernema hermaphroditum TaxID=289476 RepID=A0AA39HV14_9BILA|nr:hypothetical protein QR680_006289 [Steinernema hermaphroditum]
MFRPLLVVLLVSMVALFCTVSGNRCGKNEVWMECASCEASCEYPSPICSMECEPKPKCQCPQGAGFVRLPDNSCGHKSECKRQMRKKKLRLARSITA